MADSPNLIQRLWQARKPPQENTPAVKDQEEAFSERTLIYSKKDFPKYNPDDLIGKKGFAIYKKMMLDEQCKAAIRFKRDAITSRDYTFQLDPNKYKISQKEAQRRIKIMSRIVEEMDGSFLDALNGIMSASYNGVSYTEMVLRLIQIDGVTWYGIKRLKLKPFDTFKFEVDQFGNILKLIQCGYGSNRDLDIDKFIHYVINPDVDEHYGQSELREAYRAWFSKDIAIKFQNIWLEKHAGGVRWAQIRENKTLAPNSPEYSTLQDVLANINTSTGMIMPSSVELKGDYPSPTAAFEDAIKNYDLQIARALLVPPLLGVSPQSDTGSYSQSKTQFEAFMWTLQSDTARLEEALNEQLFRKIGDLNWGDEAWPRFKFKPLSKAAIMELLTSWGTLVGNGTVTKTAKDEAYIRELLEFPAMEQVDEDQGALLNGAQVTSMLEIITAISDGRLTGEGAVQILISAFGVSEETAKLIAAGAVAKAAEEPANGDGQPGADQPDGNDMPDANDMPANKNPADVKKEDAPIEETVRGVQNISVSSFTKAASRVDFSVIANTSDAVTEEYTKKTGEIGFAIAKDMIEKAEAASPDLSQSTQPAIDALKTDPKMMKSLKKAYIAMLTEGRMIGIKNAEREIDKAKNKAFSMTVDRERLKFIADDYYQMTSFKLAGNLTDEYVKIIEQQILQGSKAGWTWKQVSENIYSIFASKGLMTVDDAKDMLGDAFGVENPDARLRTIVRTSTFDAINNARIDYFTDPALGGFVTAFEYSAILDSRTTEICRHLDEDDEGDHSVEWYSKNSQYVPPNHYNCRSVLIPVTVIDTDFVEGPEPSIEPQLGFSIEAQSAMLKSIQDGQLLIAESLKEISKKDSQFTINVDNKQAKTVKRIRELDDGSFEMIEESQE